jgi:hypothetical protein
VVGIEDSSLAKLIEKNMKAGDWYGKKV